MLYKSKNDCNLLPVCSNWHVVVFCVSCFGLGSDQICQIKERLDHLHRSHNNFSFHDNGALLLHRRQWELTVFIIKAIFCPNQIRPQRYIKTLTQCWTMSPVHSYESCSVALDANNARLPGDKHTSASAGKPGSFQMSSRPTWIGINNLIVQLF